MAVGSEDFVVVYNNTKDYPSIQDVANKLGIAQQTVKNRAAILRKQFAEGKSTTAIVMRSMGYKIGDIEIEDIPSPEEPIEDLIERAIKHNEKQHEFASRRNLVDVNLHIEGPFGIVGLPDQHLNNPGTLLRKAMEDAKIIQNTEGLYCVAVGDWLDNFIIGRLERERRNDIMTHDDGNRIQEYYVTLIAEKLLAAIGGNHCLDDQTEALTDSGWKHYWELSETDKVLGIHPQTGESVWQSINRIIVEPNKEDSLHVIKNNVMSLHCTSEHRILRSRRKKSNGMEVRWKELGFDKLSELKRGRIKIPVSASSIGAGVNLTDAQIRLAGFVLTDGNFYKKGQYTRVSIVQRLSNADVIQQSLIDCGYVFDRKERDRDIKQICGKILKKRPEISVEFNLDATESRRFVNEIMDQKSTMPEWAYRLDKRQFDVFLVALIEGDGSFYADSDNCFVFYNRKPLIDELQALCVMNGYSASIREYRPGDFRLNICRRSFVEFDYTDKSKSQVTYDGNVWCVNVEHGNFMIRRDGKAHFTGNSQWPVMLGGVDPLGELFRRLNKQGIYDSDEMRVRLNLPSGQNFIHLVRHIFPGHSKYNTAHGVLAWMLDRWQGESVLWGGHIHSSAHVAIEREHLGESMVVHGVQLSSYKTLDRYAVTRGFRRNSPFVAPVIIHIPETRKTLFFEDIEQGVDYLKHLRKRFSENKSLANMHTS